MNEAFTSSVAAILSAPWHQRRNRKALWSVALIVALCALGPVCLFAWSVLGDPLLAPNLRHSAAGAARMAALALSAAWWAVLVNNVLEQNHPTLAQVVPGHPRRLREALVVAWAALGTALTGIVFGGVADWRLGVAIVAPSLAVLAVSVRWPWLWLAGFVAPYAVAYAMQRPSTSEFERVALAAWRAQPEAIAAAVVMASGLLLVSLIQTGGRRHAANYESRRRRMLRLQAASRGERACAPGARGGLAGLLARPYHRWMAHLLARPASSARARTLLGLGPGAHWTGNVAALAATAAAIGVAIVAALLVAQVFPVVGEFLPLGLSGLAIGVLFGLVGPAIQVQSRLHQTRREQALLTLLPGVPRGAALSRWLSGQMTVQFLLSWGGGVVLMLALGALARDVLRNPFEPAYATGRVYMVVATLPLVAFQWRRWARLPAPTSLTVLGPTLLGLALAVLAFAGQIAGVATPLQCGVAFAVAAFAWCAWRWRRMDGDPPALPVGRLA